MVHLPRCFIHTTEDQHRSFFEDYNVAPVWHGQVDDEAAMLALANPITGSPRSVWPFDMCFRTDTLSVWVCINRSDEDAGGAVALSDWFEFPLGTALGVFDTLFGGFFGDILSDFFLGGDFGTAPTDITFGGDFDETLILSGGTF